MYNFLNIDTQRKMKDFSYKYFNNWVHEIKDLELSGDNMIYDLWMKLSKSSMLFLEFNLDLFEFEIIKMKFYEYSFYVTKLAKNILIKKYNSISNILDMISRLNTCQEMFLYIILSDNNRDLSYWTLETINTINNCFNDDKKYVDVYPIMISYMNMLVHVKYYEFEHVTNINKKLKCMHDFQIYRGIYGLCKVLDLNDSDGVRTILDWDWFCIQLEKLMNNIDRKKKTK